MADQGIQTLIEELRKKYGVDGGQQASFTPTMPTATATPRPSPTPDRPAMFSDTVGGFSDPFQAYNQMLNNMGYGSSQYVQPIEYPSKGLEEFPTAPISDGSQFPTPIENPSKGLEEMPTSPFLPPSVSPIESTPVFDEPNILPINIDPNNPNNKPGLSEITAPEPEDPNVIGPIGEAPKQPWMFTRQQMLDSGFTPFVGNGQTFDDSAQYYVPFSSGDIGPNREFVGVNPGTALYDRLMGISPTNPFEVSLMSANDGSGVNVWYNDNGSFDTSVTPYDTVSYGSTPYKYLDEPTYISRLLDDYFATHQMIGGGNG